MSNGPDPRTDEDVFAPIPVGPIKPVDPGDPGDAVPPGAGMLAPGVVAQRLQTHYATAISVQKPRDMAEIRRKLLEEADLAGEEFFFGWGAGGDRIEGPSQALAHTACRIWGNCALEAQPIQDLGDAWNMPAGFVDLETGFTLIRPFRMSKKWTVYGKMDAERKMDVRFQIGASKAARNVALKALPSWLINEALDRAMEKVRGALLASIAKLTIEVVRTKAIEKLAEVGVEEPQILQKFGIAEQHGLTVDHLVILRADYRAIKDGQSDAAELYPQKGEAPPQGATEGLEAFGDGPSPTEKVPGAAEGQPAAATGQTTLTPDPRAEPAKLANEQVATLRAAAARVEVPWSAVEEAYAGPIEELVSKGGETADALEAGVRAMIRDLAKAQKVKAQKAAKAGDDK